MRLPAPYSLYKLPQNAIIWLATWGGSLPSQLRYGDFKTKSRLGWEAVIRCQAARECAKAMRHQQSSRCRTVELVCRLIYEEYRLYIHDV